MKQILFLLLLCAFFTSCSSSVKKEQPVAQVPQPAAQKAPVVQAKETPSNSTLIECIRKADTRKIEIVNEPTRKISEAKIVRVCEVNYEKYGRSERVAEAASQKEWCNEVGNRIKSNLEAAGYKCK